MRVWCSVGLLFAALLGTWSFPASARSKTAKKPRPAIKQKVTSKSKSKSPRLAPAPKAAPKTSNPQPLASRLRLESSAALVVDQRTGEALMEKRAEVVVPIASLTKLMTAMVVLDAPLDLKEFFVIEEEDADTLRHSRSRLPVGTEVSREEALMLALVASENRAAHALARTYPGGRDAFLVAMNTKARTLGMVDTHFEDPSGLSSNNVSSARDLAKLVDAAHQYPLIRDFSTRNEVEISTGRRTLEFPNTNALVRNSRWQIGLSKTGFINEAGKCLVMQAQLGGRPLLIVLLDSWGRYTRLGDANRIKQWVERGTSTLVRKGRRRR